MEDLQDSEKAENIAAIYQDIGFKPEQAYTVLHHLDKNNDKFHKFSVAKKFEKYKNEFNLSTDYY